MTGPAGAQGPELAPVVIELRTHGVSGTPPESMLNAAMVVQVAGDQLGRFFQPANNIGEPRPRVAPLQPADVVRYREGYNWGAMTSGGWRQALWAVLLPFAMVNLAQWMVPPVRGGWGPFLVFLLRGLVRTIGLFLTTLIMVQLTVIAADIIAAQCFTGRSCQQHWGVAVFFRTRPAWLALAVAAAVIVPVVVADVITKRSREGIAPDVGVGQIPAKPAAATGDRPVANIAEDDFYVRATTAPARTLHAMAALAAPTLVITGGLHPVGTRWAAYPWWIAVALLVIAVVVTFMLDDPHASGGRFSFGGRALTGPFGRWRHFGLLWWLVGAANLLAASVLVLGGHLKSLPGQRLPGIDRLLQEQLVTIAGLCLLAATLAGASALVSRGQFWHGWGTGRPAAVPKPYRPWLIGAATGVLPPLAALLGAGLGTGATQTVRSCLTVGCKPKLLASSDPNGLLLPQIYDAIALLWGLMAVGLLVAVLIAGGWLIRAAFVKDPVAQRVQGCRELLPWFVARINQQTQRIVAAAVLWSVLAAGIAVTATLQPMAAWFRAVAGPLRWLSHPLTAGPGLNGFGAFLQGLGILLLGVIVIGLLWAIYNAYRRPDTAGRSLGVLWDLASFWPSEGHPIVPPSYARKAIDDLAARVRWHLERWPQARIVLCGHSQGSLLMYATVLRLARKGTPLDRVGLVTYGSQLQWAYGRGFPDMLSYFSHQEVMALLGGRWANMIRFTDAVGGPVLSWQLAQGPDMVTAHGLLPGSPTAVGAELATGDPEPGAIRLGNEWWLPDPVLTPPIFPPRKHSDYQLDQHWDDVVTWAAGLAQPGTPLPS